MKPLHFMVAGQFTKMHRERFLGCQEQAEASQAAYPRVSFTKSIRSQSPSLDTASWPWAAAMLLAGGTGLRIQDTTMDLHQHFLWHPLTTQC